jgi:hypothetical protein
MEWNVYQKEWLLNYYTVLEACLKQCPSDLMSDYLEIL